VLTLSGIHKAYGGRALLADAALHINPGERIGLVGPNGAGKSTLFSIILGHDAPDAGQVTKARSLSIGHLPQESAPVGDETVIEVATSGHPEYVPLRRLMQELDREGSHNEAAMVGGAGSPRGRFEELGGAGLEARARQILSSLAFRAADFERPARELSGGWVMRAHLARLLVQEPALLMLDEPTNHLDLETLLWFQGYLRAYPGAVLVVSHDRAFLNALVDSIVEVREAKLARYRGNFDAFLEQRAAQEEQQLAAVKNQEREIARLMLFVDRFRAKNTKASQAQSKLKQIERMEKLEAPRPAAATVHFRFPQPERSGLNVVTLDGIRHAYGPTPVYENLTFQAQRGQRIALVGPNGAGKSTLLKLLAGVLAPQAGVRRLGYRVRSGFYSQNRVDMLRAERTVLEEALDTPQRVTEEFVRTLLGALLFRGDDVFKPVRVLSGGEKSRLALVRLLLDPPNLLLMDEPTTHLDIPSIEALIAALEQFEGTLVFISHDVHFIRSLSNHVVQVHAGRLTQYPGGYEYYLDRTRAALEPEQRSVLDAGSARAQQPAATPAAGPNRKQQRRLEAEQRQARARERGALETHVRGLETAIERLETRLHALTAELAQAATYARAERPVEIHEELSRVQGELQRLTPEWESCAQQLALWDAEPNLARQASAAEAP
jgi:ATP-binding cassette subfamily F protein 3